MLIDALRGMLAEKALQSIRLMQSAIRRSISRLLRLYKTVKARKRYMPYEKVFGLITQCAIFSTISFVYMTLSPCLLLGLLLLHKLLPGRPFLRCLIPFGHCDGGSLDASQLVHSSGVTGAAISAEFMPITTSKKGAQVLTENPAFGVHAQDSC